MSKCPVLLLIIFLAVYSCNGVGNQEQDTQNAGDKKYSAQQKGKAPIENSEKKQKTAANDLLYAEKFSIDVEDDYTRIQVFTPWQNANKISFTYILTSDPASVPDSLKKYIQLITPVKRAVIMSTTFFPFIDTLGHRESVKGISRVENFYSPWVTDAVDRGDIRDVGFDQVLNYEVLLELQPDVVFMFGVQSGIAKNMKKLNELGIQVVMVADYLEPHPLGRAEWIKFFSCFYDELPLANKIFDNVASAYDSIKKSVSNIQTLPKIMIGLPWKDTWYIPESESFAAKLIQDAGGSYLWDDLEGSEARQVDIEEVVFRSLVADIWINTGVADSKEMILMHDSRFETLPAFNKDKLYNNNKRMRKLGGNDYWESGPLHPERVLNDLVKIFHSESPEKEELYYYKHLN